MTTDSASFTVTPNFSWHHFSSSMWELILDSYQFLLQHHLQVGWHLGNDNSPICVSSWKNRKQKQRICKYMWGPMLWKAGEEPSRKGHAPSHGHSCFRQLPGMIKPVNELSINVRNGRTHTQPYTHMHINKTPWRSLVDHPQALLPSLFHPHQAKFKKIRFFVFWKKHTSAPNRSPCTLRHFLATQWAISCLKTQGTPPTYV